jgi:hypothetical protein
LADQLEMSLRAYQGRSKAPSRAYRNIHRLAVERVALRHAVKKRQPMLAPAPVRNDALELARLITGKG